MAPFLDQLLLPQRLATQAVRDVRRLADAAGSVAALAGDLRRELRPFIESIDHGVMTLDSVRDEIAGLRAAHDSQSDCPALAANAEPRRPRARRAEPAGRVTV